MSVRYGTAVSSKVNTGKCHTILKESLTQYIDTSLNTVTQEDKCFLELIIF